jgi:hypothetical protein
LRIVAIAGLRDLLDEFVHGKWLYQVAQGSGGQRADCRFDRGTTGHENDRYVRVTLAHATQELKPVHTWHVNVAHDDVEPLGQALDGYRTVARGLDLKSRRRFASAYSSIDASSSTISTRPMSLTIWLLLQSRTSPTARASHCAGERLVNEVRVVF